MGRTVLGGVKIMTIKGDWSMTRLMGSHNATMARTISTDRDYGTKREALKSFQRKGYLLYKLQGEIFCCKA